MYTFYQFVSMFECIFVYFICDNECVCICMDQMTSLDWCCVDQMMSLVLNSPDVSGVVWTR